MLVPRLRVVQLVNGIALNTKMGGAERFGVELARHFDQARIEPVVAALWEWDREHEQVWRNRLAIEGVTTVIGPPKRERQAFKNFLESIVSLGRQLEKPVDVIHSQCDFGDVAALLLARQLSVKLLVRTAHNELEWAKRPWRRWIFVNSIYPLVYDMELGVSQRVVDTLNQRPMARWLHKKALVSYNAIDVARFTNGIPDTSQFIREKLNIPPTAPVIGSVGRLTKQKGYHHFLEAAAIVSATIPSAKFLLVGSGEEEANLKRMAQDLQLQNHVIFAGAQAHVEPFLSIMDVFVSSSLWEGLPTVILEALLVGVPVVGTAVSGTEELVKGSEIGCLVEPGNPRALALGILAMLSHPPDAAARRRAKDFIKHQFSITSISSQMEQLYLRLLRQKDNGGVI
ncbi:glycosyltransferase [Litorilinea aerophila]|uniref:Glycosyltransferase n=1 Tax=Litorilinea aerophila TaxID=1204385 RepID=A0A540VD95_9CHLR|nr:glycosyltransferase [Litorilinea aerophila]MCC9077578.1 glycosyltransferase [Litorilinea aerophila]